MEQQLKRIQDKLQHLLRQYQLLQKENEKLFSENKTLKEKLAIGTSRSEAETRYYVVSSLFDQIITFRHKDLVAATKAILEAEKRLGGKVSAQLDEARKLTFTPPLLDAQTKDKALLLLFKADKQDAAATAQKTKVEEEWAQKVKANYAKAVELANAVK